MSTQFTPGPWRVNKYGGIGAGVHGVTPTILNATSWEHDWDDRSRKRQSADCALIAAAPDLYEALTELIEATKEHIPSGLDRKVIAALRKARGETAEG